MVMWLGKSIAVTRRLVKITLKISHVWCIPIPVHILLSMTIIMQINIMQTIFCCDQVEL